MKIQVFLSKSQEGFCFLIFNIFIPPLFGNVRRIKQTLVDKSTEDE